MTVKVKVTLSLADSQLFSQLVSQSRIPSCRATPECMNHIHIICLSRTGTELTTLYHTLLLL